LLHQINKFFQYFLLPGHKVLHFRSYAPEIITKLKAMWYVNAPTSPSIFRLSWSTATFIAWSPDLLFRTNRDAKII